MFSSNAQRDAALKLAAELESNGSHVSVLDLGRGWDDLGESQREFLKVLVEIRSETSTAPASGEPFM